MRAAPRSRVTVPAAAVVLAESYLASKSGGGSWREHLPAPSGAPSRELPSPSGGGSVPGRHPRTNLPSHLQGGSWGCVGLPPGWGQPWKRSVAAWRTDGVASYRRAGPSLPRREQAQRRTLNREANRQPAVSSIPHRGTRVPSARSTALASAGFRSTMVLAVRPGRGAARLAAVPAMNHCQGLRPSLHSAEPTVPVQPLAGRRPWALPRAAGGRAAGPIGIRRLFRAKRSAAHRVIRSWAPARRMADPSAPPQSRDGPWVPSAPGAIPAVSVLTAEGPSASAARGIRLSAHLPQGGPPSFPWARWRCPSGPSGGGWRGGVLSPRAAHCGLAHA